MRSVLIGFVAGLAAVFGLTWAVRSCDRRATPGADEIRRDTVIVYDTIRPPIPEPIIRTVVRYDTLRPQDKPVGDTIPPLTADTLPGDTTPSVIVSIERKVYETEDYRATVEGFRPQLVSMEIYRKTSTITNTVTAKTRPRWALTLGPGVGYGPKGVQPYVGVSFGFVLWSK